MGACQPSAVTASAGLHPQAPAGLDQRRSPHGAEPFKVLSLFAGIGGFDLGLERTGGFKTVAFCEIEPFAVRVLNKHWPEVPVYGDVRELTGEQLRADGITVDVIVGGFPCQDISSAGAGAGIEGERSGLWSEYARLIGEIRPRYVIVENVAALLGRGLDKVLGDLAEVGYDAEWHCIPASAVGAPHRRDRLWVISYPAFTGPQSAPHAGLYPGEAGEGPRDGKSQRLCGPFAPGALADSPRQLLDWSWAARETWRRESSNRGWWATEPQVGRMAHGVRGRTHRLKSLGNAVVPQIPELIGRAILRAEGRA